MTERSVDSIATDLRHIADEINRLSMQLNDNYVSASYTTFLHNNSKSAPIAYFDITHIIDHETIGKLFKGHVIDSWAALLQSATEENLNKRLEKTSTALQYQINGLKTYTKSITERQREWKNRLFVNAPDIHIMNMAVSELYALPDTHSEYFQSEYTPEQTAFFDSLRGEYETQNMADITARLKTLANEVEALIEGGVEK